MIALSCHRVCALLAALVMVVALGQPVQAQAPVLEEIFDRCNAFGAGKVTAFKGMAPVKVDTTDDRVTYQRIDTDAGLVTVKLVDGKDCWIYGARFAPGHRSTTVAWDDVRARAHAWVFQPGRGKIAFKTENDAGFNAVICKGDGKAHQDTATGGGTDDKARALAFSSRQYPLEKCS